MIEAVTPNKARTYALQAGTAMLLAVLFASITFNIFGHPLTLLFVPFIVLFLWPKGADPVYSYLAIFLTGLLLDILHGDPMGGWPLIYLPFFALMVFFNAAREAGFGETWLNFLIWMTAFSGFFVIAKMIGFLDVDYFSLAKLSVINLFLFPFVFFFKARLRNVLVSEDG